MNGKGELSYNCPECGRELRKDVRCPACGEPAVGRDLLAEEIAASKRPSMREYIDSLRDDAMETDTWEMIQRMRRQLEQEAYERQLEQADAGNGDRVQWMLERIRGGLADELQGLNVDGGEAALRYARDLLYSWCLDAFEVLKEARDAGNSE